MVFGKGEARARALLDFLAAKRRQGIDLTADEYPYNAGYTGIAHPVSANGRCRRPIMPRCVAERRQELRDYLERRMTRRGGPGSAAARHRALCRQDRSRRPRRQAGLHYADFLIKLGPEGGSGAHFTMDKVLQDTLLVDPHVAFSTDGGPGMRHPRATGTYAKLIEDYVVRDKKLTIEEMVRKATGFPAQILRLRRSRRDPGRAPRPISSCSIRRRSGRASTYVDPFAMAEGFDLVMVNGRPAFEGRGRACAETALNPSAAPAPGPR